MPDSAVPPEAVPAERDLLERAEDALHSIALDLLAVSPHLKVPYTDLPEASPWSMYTGPQARRAHDLAMEIRRHLGLPHRWRTRASGTPPLEERDVVAAAVAGERARIAAAAEAAAFTLFRPGNGPAHGQHLAVVPLAELRTLIGDPDA